MSSGKVHTKALSVYALAVVFLWLKMFILYKMVFHININSLREELVLAFSSLGSAALFLGFGFIFREKWRVKALFGILMILTLLLYGNVLYYRFFIDFITVPVLLQFQNVGGLSQSTLELIKLPDILLFLDFAIMIILLKREAVPNFRYVSRRKAVRMIALLVIIPIMASLLVNPGFWKKSYDRELIVKSIGLYHYHLYDLLLHSKTTVNSVFADGAEIMAISDYTDKKQKNAVRSDLHGIAEGKNVVVIFLESTQAFVIDKKVHNEEVTPFLNQLLKIVFTFQIFTIRQHKGKHLMLNSSLIIVYILFREVQYLLEGHRIFMNHSQRY